MTIWNGPIRMRSKDTGAYKESHELVYFNNNKIKKFTLHISVFN